MFSRRRSPRAIAHLVSRSAPCQRGIPPDRRRFPSRGGSRQVVRIRIGEGWASDPEVRAGLRAGSAEPRRAAIRAIVDVVAVEVEGVDIARREDRGARRRGRARDAPGHRPARRRRGARLGPLRGRGGRAPPAPPRRASRCSPWPRSPGPPGCSPTTWRWTFPGSPRRRGRPRPPSATAWLEIAPATRALPELRRLLRAATRTPPRWPPRGPAPSRRPAPGGPAAGARDAACSFEIHDEAGRLSTWRGPGADLASLLVRGRVSFRSPAGDEFLSVAGAPYLTFRDLCAAAARFAASPGAPVAFDLARPGRNATSRVTVADGAVSVDGGRPGPVRLPGTRPGHPRGRRRLLRGGPAPRSRPGRERPALRPGGLGGRHPRPRPGGPRGRPALRVPAPGQDRPGGAPLPPSPGAGQPAPGLLPQHRLRRRRAAGRGRAPPPGRRARRLRPGDGRSRSTPRRGTVLWSAPGAFQCAADDRAVVAPARRAPSRRATSGPGRSSGPGRRPAEADARSALSLAPGGRLFVASGPSVSTFDASRGGALWTFVSPGAARLSLLPLGPLLVVAVRHRDGPRPRPGRAGGLAPARRRARSPLRSSGTGRSCLLSFLTPTGATLAAVDPSTGARALRGLARLHPRRSAAPVRRAHRASPGSVAGDAVIAALEEDGSPAWAEPSPTGGAPSLAPCGAGCSPRGPTGPAPRWTGTAGRSGSGPARGGRFLPGNLPPVAARGVVLVAPRRRWTSSTPRRGAPVGRVPAHAPARLVVDGDLTTWALDAEGLAHRRPRARATSRSWSDASALTPRGRGAGRS